MSGSNSRHEQATLEEFLPDYYPLVALRGNDTRYFLLNGPVKDPVKKVELRCMLGSSYKELEEIARISFGSGELLVTVASREYPGRFRRMSNLIFEKRNFRNLDEFRKGSDLLTLSEPEEKLPDRVIYEVTGFRNDFTRLQLFDPPRQGYYPRYIRGKDGTAGIIRQPLVR